MKKLIKQKEFIKNPVLRFPGFSNKWNKKKLEEIFYKKQKRNIDNKYKYVLTNSATEGIVSQLDYFEKDIANQNNLTNYYIVDINDFIYNPRISKFAPVGPLKRNKLAQGIMSPLYIVLGLKNGNPDFWEYYFDTTFWHHYMYKIANYGARHDRMNILQNDFLKMPLPFPSIQEQQKIADFLNSVNKWIENLYSQKKTLEDYKKIIMKKLFNQEIRFKANNGDNFPKWEEKKLANLNSLMHGDGDWILSKDISINGQYKIVQLGNIGFGKYVIKKLKTLSKEKFIELNGTLIKKGDLLINRMIDNKVYCCVFEKNGDYVTSVDVCWIRENKQLNNYFFMSLILLESNQIKLMRLSSGSGRVRISKRNLFNEFTFKMPHYSEQKKIADFLISIDKLIEAKQEQIQIAIQWKKGLLQKLFV